MYMSLDLAEIYNNDSKHRYDNIVIIVLKLNTSAIYKESKAISFEISHSPSSLSVASKNILCPHPHTLNMLPSLAIGTLLM